MNYASVLRVLAVVMLVLAVGSLSAALVAGLAGEPGQIVSFTATALGILVFSSTFLLIARRPERPARASDGLAVALLFWFISPFAAAMPFLFGVANDDFSIALYEAASCLTTTGHSRMSFSSDWPVSLLYWRGLLHLIGTSAFVVMAAGVLAAINLGGPGVHRTVLFTLPDTSYFDALGRIWRSAVLMITIMTGFVFILLLMGGSAPARALGDAVSAVSTGLVFPDSGAVAASSQARPALVLGLIAGALGFALWLPLRSGALGTLISDPELVVFAVLVILVGLSLLPLGLSPGDSLAWALSALSTSGMVLTPGAGAAEIPLTLAVIPCLIGGSALSAAGGIKIARFIVLARRAGQEFRQLGYRRSVLSFRFRDRELDERSVIGVWVYFIVYVIAIFLIMSAFSFLGIGFEDATRLAIGGLTNAGGLLAGVTSEPGSASLLLSSFAMVLGRVEILTLLPALSVSFWRG